MLRSPLYRDHHGESEYLKILLFLNAGEMVFVATIVVKIAVKQKHISYYFHHRQNGVTAFFFGRVVYCRCNEIVQKVQKVRFEINQVLCFDTIEGVNCLGNE